VVCQGQFTPQITKVTKKLLNSFDQDPLKRPFSSSYPAIAPPSFPGRPGTSILLDGDSERSFNGTQTHYGTGKKSTKGGRCTYIFCTKPEPTVDWFNLARVTIDMLPDVALLEIFESHVDWAGINAWRTLVHVCRNWRNVVFGSPHRLDLQLFCTPRMPVREMLDIWPPFPLNIEAYRYEMWDVGRVDNVVAALERNDRLNQLRLIDISSSQFEKVLPAMQQPFPALIRLHVGFGNEIDEATPVVPASFLGGSAPRLQTLTLMHIPFPGLPKLLLSTTHLVHLFIYRIPHSGYISPEAIVTSLSMLTRLEFFNIDFESPRSRPDQRSRRPPPAIRTLLPVLTMLEFKGACEYLEDLVARIDAPLLDNLAITFFHQLIFETPQLTQFITRLPKLMTHDKAHVAFSNKEVSVTLAQPFQPFDRRLQLGISCIQPDWQLSSLAQICGSSFPQTLIPAVEDFYISEGGHWVRQDDIENSQWLELFHPFTAVKDLYISREFVPLIGRLLQELVGERVTEVLPALQTLFLETLSSGPVQEAIEQFVAVRQLAGHPIIVSHWERKVI
jgi:hypothetical protein